MKQVFLSGGEIRVQDSPSPTIKSGEILVRTAFSLISTGTELSANKKILSDSENIKKGFKFLKEKGVLKTLEMVKDKMENPTPLGYSLSGIVVAIGNDVGEFKIGDMVACAGAGKANHAEFVAVPKNLAIKVPDSVNFEDASSVTLGAIAMQGLRRADVKLGEKVAVIGLGLLGQILVQLLKSNGAKVIGFDVSEDKVNLAKELGADRAYNSGQISIFDKISDFTSEKGVDVTIITASAPQNDEIIQQAMEITRKKGRVVVVGNVGLGPKRSPFYEKEIDYLISTSYGPGRYDASYEERGIDYPFAYVRWTEKRNMEEYLDLLAEKKVNFKGLIAKTFPVEQAPEAYKSLKGSDFKKPAVLLDYNLKKEKHESTKLVLNAPNIKDKIINVGIIGTGGFARGMHLPNLKRLPDLYCIRAICDLDGGSCASVAKRYGANYCTTNYKEILEDKDINMVIITLPHNLHAKISIEAIRAGKAVFCEKPMALSEREVSQIEEAVEENKTPYLVGFNRRFSPFIKKTKEILRNRENPIIIDYHMNAGFIPKDHWTQTNIGGGRNLGEACHIYDLFGFLTESEVNEIGAVSIDSKSGKQLKNDNFVATIKFKDGSVCNLVYSAIGSKDYPKEQMKIYTDGKIIFLDDYKKLKVFGGMGNGLNMRQDKGHLQELKEFAESMRGGSGYPIPLWQLSQATKISLEVEKRIAL